MIGIDRQQMDTAAATRNRDQHVIPEVALSEFRVGSHLLRNPADHVARREDVRRVGHDYAMGLESINESPPYRRCLVSSMSAKEELGPDDRVKIDGSYERTQELQYLCRGRTIPQNVNEMLSVQHISWHRPQASVSPCGLDDRGRHRAFCSNPSMMAAFSVMRASASFTVVD